MSGKSPFGYELIPLDTAIIETLPDEGATMGYHVRGRQVRAIADALNAKLSAEERDGGGAVRSSIVNGRMRILKHEGYVVDVHVTPSSGGRGWQRTAKGKALAQRTRGR
jgi:hypothetical protein